MASVEDTDLVTGGLTVRKLKDIMNKTLPSGVRKRPPARAQPIGAIPSPLFINMQSISPDNQYDEVYEDIYLGDLNLAKDKEKLQQVGITHVVNAAQGPKFGQINTDADYYTDLNITFFGINAIDTPRYKMHKHFHSAADFIQDALDNIGKVYVHCQHGLSRSATIVLAFLMLKRSLTLEEAVICVRQKRPIMPNEGFLQQLIDFDQELQCLKNIIAGDGKMVQTVTPSDTVVNKGRDNVGDTVAKPNETVRVSSSGTAGKSFGNDDFPKNCELSEMNTPTVLSQDKTQALATTSDENTAGIRATNDGIHENPIKCNKSNSIEEIEQSTSQLQGVHTGATCEETDCTSTEHEKHEPLTLEKVKEVMSFTVPLGLNTKKIKNRVKSATVLFVKNGNRSSPAPVNDIDKVHDGIYLGNHKIARDKRGLKALGITHILNTACGPGGMQVDTSQAYYEDIGVSFCGIPAKDVMAYKLEKHFNEGAEFIAKAVSSNGKILVNCHQGRSRSAAIVLAYLMLKENVSLLDAIVSVRQKRWIWPNDGFLNQLIKLNTELFGS